MTIEEIIDAVQKLGYGIAFFDDDAYIEINDMCFYVDYDNLNDFDEDVKNVWEDFDIDEYVYDYLCAKHNGFSGVPSVKELLKDAEEIDAGLEKIWRKLNQIREANNG